MLVVFSGGHSSVLMPPWSPQAQPRPLDHSSMGIFSTPTMVIQLNCSLCNIDGSAYMRKTVPKAMDNLHAAF